MRLCKEFDHIVVVYPPVFLSFSFAKEFQIVLYLPIPQTLFITCSIVLPISVKALTAQYLVPSVINIVEIRELGVLRKMELLILNQLCT